MASTSSGEPNKREDSGSNDGGRAIAEDVLISDGDTPRDDHRRDIVSADLDEAHGGVSISGSAFDCGRSLHLCVRVCIQDRYILYRSDDL